MSVKKMSAILTHHVPMRDPMSASATKDIRETDEHVQVENTVQEQIRFKIY